MSDIKAVLGEGAVELELDEGLYPKDAIYGAAYVFIDRCYVHLDRAGDRRVKVTLRSKKGAPLDSQACAGELENELLAQAWRRQILDENRQLVEAITTRALGGAAGPPGLDELLAMDIGEATAFDDPLGIAMSWEEKYKKKGTAAAAEPAPSPGAEVNGDASAAGKAT
jgi:His-Xaa-Ser system protein HxsD